MGGILEDAEAVLTPLMRNLINMLWDEWKTVERQVEELYDALEPIAAADAGFTRIRQTPALGRWLQPPSLLPSATALPFARAGSSPRGWALCCGSTRPETRPSCSASVSEATFTFARS